ncbi:hypothetical protein FFLO_05232 [Filobasidium floriforme]|uniref:Uncharacterized protein n=2 Tax=Filobasidium floriforme TaxID=5210 RepID=A0A8K0NRJ9_9TREE|nr:hypothetical protein FFLO_05232 [Filobasidium floriforme]
MVFDELGGNCSDYDAWLSSCLPLKKPIIIVGVVDRQDSWNELLKKVEKCDALAIHKLEYAYSITPALLKFVFERDPEGTIESKEQTEIVDLAG